MKEKRSPFSYCLSDFEDTDQNHTSYEACLQSSPTLEFMGINTPFVSKYGTFNSVVGWCTYVHKPVAADQLCTAGLV